MRSAVILAGGRGSRLGFREKAFLQFRGSPLVCRVFRSLRGVVDEFIVSVRDSQQAETFKRALGVSCGFVFDVYPGAGPLAGMLAGLEKAGGKSVFICACDMPFIQPDGVEFLFQTAEERGVDAVIPRWKTGLVEPLHAVYDRSAMACAAEEALERDEKIILAPISRLRIKYVPAEKISPESFVNINSPGDAARLGMEV